MTSRRTRRTRGCARGIVRRIVAFAFFVCCVLDPRPGLGQTPRLELDITGSRIKYDTLAALNAPSLGVLGEWQRPSVFARASASLAGFENAGWSAQARGSLAGWMSPFGVLSPLRLELAGAVGGVRHSSGFDSFVVRGDARLHARSRTFGAWVGAGLASARNSFDSASVSGVVPSAGVWAQRGPIRTTLSYVQTTLSGDAYPEADAAITFSRGPADLTVYAGLRRSPLDGVEDELWAGVSAAYWATDNAALLVSTGEYSSDILQGLPGGHFVSVGLRLTPRRARPIPVSAPAPIVYTREEARDGSISFLVDGATRVEIAGDWNGWTTEPLSRNASGRWVVPAGLQPGVYRFNLRVDGERWIVPEDVPSTDDGYGGRVGLLIISGDGTS